MYRKIRNPEDGYSVFNTEERIFRLENPLYFRYFFEFGLGDEFLTLDKLENKINELKSFKENNENEYYKKLDETLIKPLSGNSDITLFQNVLLDYIKKMEDGGISPEKLERLKIILDAIFYQDTDNPLTIKYDQDLVFIFHDVIRSLFKASADTSEYIFDKIKSEERILDKLAILNLFRAEKINNTFLLKNVAEKTLKDFTDYIKNTNPDVNLIENFLKMLPQRKTNFIVYLYAAYASQDTEEDFLGKNEIKELKSSEILDYFIKKSQEDTNLLKNFLLSFTSYAPERDDKSKMMIKCYNSGFARNGDQNYRLLDLFIDCFKKDLPQNPLPQLYRKYRKCNKSNTEKKEILKEFSRLLKALPEDGEDTSITISEFPKLFPELQSRADDI